MAVVFLGRVWKTQEARVCVRTDLPGALHPPAVRLSRADWTHRPCAAFPLAPFRVLRDSADVCQLPEFICMLMLFNKRDGSCCFRLAVTVLLYQINTFFGCFQKCLFVLRILVIKKYLQDYNVVSFLQDGADRVDWEPRNKEFRIQLREAISETNGINIKEWELH